MNKVYIVTEGDYSDYHIEACFTTKQKAEEYIENSKKVEDSNWYRPGLEVWDLDTNTEIVNVITLDFTFTSPLSKRKYQEQIKTRVEKNIESKAFRYWGKVEFWGADYQQLTIKEIQNPNKTIEEEIARLTKVAYDTAKKINYLYKVENIKTLEEIRKRLN